MTTAEILAALDDIERATVRCVYFDGLSTTDAAQRLGLGRSQVVRALASALRRVAGFVMDAAESGPGPSSSRLAVLAG